MPGKRAWMLALLVTVAGCGTSASICSRTPADTAAFTSAVPMGSAVRWSLVQTDPGYARFFLAHYSWLTPENELKMQALEPQRGKFSFAAADGLVAWARSHGKAVHGHVLIWGQQLPAWLTSLARDRRAVRRAMDSYIRTVLAHFRGRVGEWDVVNEALSPDGGWQPNFWLTALGPGYVVDAFRLARAVDPHARLCYNDDRIDQPSPHMTAALELVSALHRQRLLDCVGFELHRTVADQVEPSIGPALRRFARLGVKVLISEMDVSVGGAEPNVVGARQGRIFGQVATACRQVTSCTRFTTWGFTDASSWLGSDARALPFDADCRPKPAWRALQLALRR